jgi:hypothetical protein
MIRKILVLGAAISISGFLGCGDPVSGNDKGETPAAPAGTQAVFAEGFGGDLSKWDNNYMITVGDYYPHMRITDEVAHSGKYCATTDSNRTALLYKIDPRLEGTVCNICGVEFYIMSKGAGKINFTVELGQNAGSSGGLGKAFGVGFDVRDSIKSTSLDPNRTSGDIRLDKLVGTITPGKWYKCKIEIDFTAKTATYYIDDNKVDQHALPTVEMYGIDRMLVYRGKYGGTNDYPIECSEGSKQYFVDDIVLYKK